MQHKYLEKDDMIFIVDSVEAEFLDGILKITLTPLTPTENEPTEIKIK